MKRILVIAALLLTTTAAASLADEMPGSAHHHSIGLGFHNTSAPVGVRWWMSGQKLGIDLGIGYSSRTAESDPDERLTGWALDAGVPLVMHSWDRAHILFRPGVLYQSEQEGSGFGPTFETTSPTNLALTIELEAEVFLVDNISFSAAHGIGFGRFDPDIPGVDASTAFSTLGSNFTEVGFHMYFLGGER
jgi:hypothetical protein